MRCHSLNCDNEAAEGSQFCTTCMPPAKKPLTELEQAQVRVAKATEARELLHKEIMKEYGSIAELDDACRHEPNKTTGKAPVLRRKYNNASKDLRLAESDLERMRNEEKQKATAEKIRNAPCPACGRLKDGPMCKACGPANDYVEFRNKTAGIADRVEAEIAKNKEAKASAPIELKDAKVEGDAIVAPATPELRAALRGKEGTATVIGTDGKGGMIVELKDKEPAPERPAEKKTAAQVMEENAQKAEANKAAAEAEAVGAVKDHIKKAKQVDIYGDDLKLPIGVKETKKVSRSRTYEITDFKISIKEDDLADFNHWPPFKQRTFVAMKLRYVPEEEDAIYSDDDFDCAIEEMTRILVRASFILGTERQREAILMQRLAEMI